ncbi:ABA4-like family protein [Planotetraspora sp. A-T 1434]|uniref:ABA4-like family protein n=1 Tax=Planotetraspora sp. A-T 1434 TaxID=2979219 RepID=UPI0021C13165|nr:ABA4-like family protein [Planotetraspora sp. A-T 1434]MCT9930536.1 ABA4-like family protein [Planotetraspora sp. A-T 1434]
MTETLFRLTFPLAVPFWALMIFAPGWTWTRRIVSSPLIIVPPLLVYLALAIPNFAGLWAAVSRPDLEVLGDFFGSPAGAAALWAHLIGFDLFVGRWMYLDSRDKGTSPLVTGPILALTILLSPIGTLIYLAVRTLSPARADGRRAVIAPQTQGKIM